MIRSDRVTHDLFYDLRDHRTPEFEMFWLSWGNKSEFEMFWLSRGNKDTHFNTPTIPPMRVIFDAIGNVTFSDIITNPKRIM